MTQRLGSQPEFLSELNLVEHFISDGVEIWINPQNKFLIFQLHYLADPKKRNDMYRDSVKSSMPRAQYLQEYELQWDSFAGMPVYPDFQENRHGSRTRLQPEFGLPLLRGWDFGLTPACVIAQLQDDQLVILAEFTEKNMGATRFVPKVIAQCAVMFPEWADQKNDWRDFADPSGAFRKDTDENTCFNIMGEFGLSPVGGAIAWEERRSSVEQFLLKQTKNGPGLLLDLSTTPVLTRGFKGGYRYPDSYESTQPNKIRPLKDEHSHAHDALQMITSRLVMTMKQVTVTMKKPYYSWMTRKIKPEVPSYGNET